jgi:hypothetical protein
LIRSFAARLVVSNAGMQGVASLQWIGGKESSSERSEVSQ